MYKMIALDMDGTLLNNSKTISKENIKAVNEAKKKGIHVVLATGRSLKGVENYLNDLNLIDDKNFLVSFNGGMVQNTTSTRIIFKNYMKLKEDVCPLYELSKKLDLDLIAFTSNKCLTPKITEYSKVDAKLNNTELEVFDFNANSDDPSIIKLMFVGDKEKIDAAVEKMPENFKKKYTIMRSAPIYLEFSNDKVNKGSGLKHLSEELGVKSEEIISIGDAGNDIHMVKYAGLGVAMGNAFPELKKIANYTTKTNEENGVAHVINKFILKTL
ncbi:Cof-type HAD-IIB family hydrolase [Clostridium oceanicum]|uniref:Sugar-phosphatase n=1 Tax=Clostridium oceanicum TaxID=1543 RepID=A0ABP3UGF2_9CLOT